MTSRFQSYLYLLFTFSALFTSITCSPLLPNREMIILQETTNAENINETLNARPGYGFKQSLHPRGIGALTINFLIALHQKAAPILVNKSLIKNLIDHQNLFNDFITLDRSSLYSKYARYNRFKGRIALNNFRINCGYTSQSLSKLNEILNNLKLNPASKNIYANLERIVNDRRFNINFAPENIQRLNYNPEETEAFQLEMVVYTLCHWVNLKKDWIIKQVNEEIFLLIPQNYIARLNIESNNKDSQNSKNRSRNQFTDLEIKLGLKIDHMKTVNRSFFEQQAISTIPFISFLKSLEQIFITATDIKKYNLPENNNCWSLYLAGHGFPKCAKISILPQLYELKKLVQKKLKAPHFKECLKHEKEKYQRLHKKNNHLDLCKHHTAYHELMTKIKKLTQEIKKAESITKSTNKMDQGMIACLSIDEFRELLKFFNTAIETNFLHYTSCFAGGSHFIDPYTDPISGKILTFKYPIIAGTPAENMSMQEFPVINLPPYTSIGRTSEFRSSQLDIESIDWNNNTLALCTTLQFNNFFSALRKGIHHNPKKLILISYALHPHVDEFGKLGSMQIPNIPLVRLANSDCFQPIPYDTSSVIIDAKNHTNAITIDKEATLLYADYIKGRITLNTLSNDNARPSFISMIPGFALHVFEEISSSTLNLNQIINSFFTFPELGSSKIFWIKKLECTSNNNPNQKKIHKDVIIMRNVFTSNTLAQCSSESIPTPLENCAYFSTPTNQNARLMWNSPFIEGNNYQVNFCNQSAHKEECLHFFPKMAKFLNPVFQNT